MLQHSPVLANVFERLSTLESERRSYRQLKNEEITQLLEQGCSCPYWEKIFVHPNFSPDRVWRSSFSGSVYLGAFPASLTGGDFADPSPGIFHCRIIGSHVLPAKLLDVRWLEGMVVDKDSSLFRMDICSWSGEHSSCLGTQCNPGTEESTRSVWLLSNLDVEKSFQMANFSHSEKILFMNELNCYLKSCQSQWGYIGQNCHINGIPRIENCLISDNVSIQQTNSILNSVLLSTPDNPTALGAAVILENCLVQPGVCCGTGALARQSALLNSCHLEDRIFVTQSIIGPFCHFGRGEVVASLVGPLVAGHHQSLLISAIWPLGKGNIGYGANVGSNHTGKKPDQEIFPGEGTFFGLSSSYKFPINLSMAPYSIISTGAILPPQKYSFPFSLISPASSSDSAAISANEAIPGWTWSHNAYALFRNSNKYSVRSKGLVLATSLFRPSIAQWCMSALSTLESLAPPSRSSTWYYPAEVKGLGAQHMSESSAHRASAAYKEYLSLCALYFNSFQEGVKLGWVFGPLEADIPPATQLKSLTEQILEILQTELQTLINQLPALTDSVMVKVIRPIERDWEKGVAIDSNYAVAHPLPKADPLIPKLHREWTLLAKALEVG